MHSPSCTQSPRLSPRARKTKQSGRLSSWMISSRIERSLQSERAPAGIFGGGRRRRGQPGARRHGAPVGVVDTEEEIHPFEHPFFRVSRKRRQIGQEVE